MSKRAEQKSAQYYVRSMSYSIKAEITYEEDYFTNSMIEKTVHRNTGKFETQLLQRPDPLKSTSDLSTDSVNAWFEGSMGISATRLNPGQRFYFSPVGYILKITEDKEVLANFRADGNVGTRCRLNQEDEKGRTAIQNICQAIFDNKQIPEDLLREHKGFSTTNISPTSGVNFIKKLMKGCQSRGLGHILQECLRQAGTEAVVDYYKFKGHQSRYIQSGLITDDKFEPVESLYRDLCVNSEGEIIEAVIGKKSGADDKGKYTESVVHCTANNLDCVFASIDTAFIKYGTNIDDAWKITDSKNSDKAADALSARLKSMQELHNELKVANPTLKFAVLDDKGKLYTTSEEKHITALLQICKSKVDDWQETLLQSVRENFASVDKAKYESQPSEDLMDTADILSDSAEEEEKERDIFNVSDDLSGLAVQSSPPISMAKLLVTEGITSSKNLVKPAIISTSESIVSLSQSS